MRRFFSAALAAIFMLAPLAARADRIIVYPGQNPQSTQTNQQPRFARLAFGTWIRDALGPTASAGGVYNNLTATPNGGLFVAVQPSLTNTLGSLYQIAADDTTPVPASGSTQIPADPTRIIIQALQATPSGSLGPMTAPGSGTSQYYLVEAQVQTTDTTPLSITFVNSNGTQSSQSVNTRRADQIVYQLKAGVASGTPTVPTVDSGWIGISTVLLPSGASSVTTGMIAALPPFSGFIANGANVTIGGLTLSGAPAGCLQANGSGVVSSLPCTSGLGSVTGSAPLSFNTVSGVATGTCATCVTSVLATGPLSSSGGTTPNITLGTVPVAKGGTGVTSIPTSTCIGWSGSLFTSPLCIGAATAPLSVSGGSVMCTTCAQKTVDNSFSTGQTIAGSVYAHSGYGSQAIKFDSGTTSGLTGLFASSGSSVGGVPCSAFDFSDVTTNTFLCGDTSGNLGVKGSFQTGLSVYGPTSATINGSLLTQGDVVIRESQPQIEFAGTGAVAPIKWIRANGTNGKLEFTNSAYTAVIMNLDDSGNLTATNFFNGSRREWKKNIKPFTFDALGVLKATDLKQYDCSDSRCGPIGTHKIGFIANDTPTILSGPKHDHFDAAALATVDAAAILQVSKRLDRLESTFKHLCQEKKNRTEAACARYVH